MSEIRNSKFESILHQIRDEIEQNLTSENAMGQMDEVYKSTMEVENPLTLDGILLHLNSSWYDLVTAKQQEFVNEESDREVKFVTTKRSNKSLENSRSYIHDINMNKSKTLFKKQTLIVLYLCSIYVHVITGL